MKAIIAAAILGVIMMFASIVMNEKKNIVSLAALLMLVLLGVNIWELTTMTGNVPERFFNNMISIDRYAIWFNTLMTACTLVYILLVGQDVRRVGSYVGEYFALIFFILVGVFLLSSYNNMLMMFLGIEILSIPQYILAGSDKRSLKSSEASLKYFLLGSFSTGILLMGITLLYGASGTFYVAGFNFFQTATISPMALTGVILVMIAFAFKVSAAPFHLWTPDVYDGAPTPFTAYMATVVKVAAFLAFLRLFHNAFSGISERWMLALAVVTAATLLIGNITAVFQQSVKRMLAYSSIAQAGFMLIAVLSVNSIAWQGILIYAVAYSLATIGIFAVLMKLKDYTFDGFNGLGRREPALAFVTTVFLMSLAGIPLTAGFWAKYYVLSAAVSQGNLFWLVIFALLMAAISVYYYFRVIMAMYFKQGTPEFHSPVSGSEKWMLAVVCALVFVLGVAPQLLLGVV